MSKSISIKATLWNTPGDHPRVQPYGPDLLYHMPNYAKCGTLERDFKHLHVAPGYWVLDLPDGTFEVASPKELASKVEALATALAEPAGN